MSSMDGNILLAGATGLVGSQVLQQLLADSHWHGRVIAPVRRKLSADDVRLVPLLTDFSDRPDRGVALEASLKSLLAGERIATFVSCLGTTIKTAGSREAFIAIDRELVLRLAALARKLGARQAILVSSAGASRQSGNFYLRVKGEVEDGIEALGFDRVDLLRPGLLIGARNERRSGEAVAQALSPIGDLFLRGRLARYRSIPASDVAKALLQLTGKAEEGVFAHDTPALEKLAAG
jgi:uncharacterized protein YbjT (DUF2867 family)